MSRSTSGGAARSWILPGVLLAMVATVLVVGGLASLQGGNDAAGAQPSVGTAGVPESVSSGGPLVDASTLPPRSRSVPARTIALTFDDGPDAVWTPQVLAVLRRYHVPATFFVVGSNAARLPDVVRAIHDSGSELGVHTFSHPDLGRVSRWRLDRELAETQLAIAGSAGITTYLLRPPYSGSAAAIDDVGYRTVLAAAQDGYVSVFTTADTEDWQRPGVPAILRNGTPPPGATAGSVVLMHDAGGDRSQTVAALERYIPLMQAQGYRFTTVTGAFGLSPADAAATPHDRLLGEILLGTLSVATTIVAALSGVLLVVGVLVVLRLLLMVVAAGRHARRRRSPDFSWGQPVGEPVSVIVPAYNEIKNIEATVRSILANDQPLEVVVVDDGSSDGTADLVESLGLDRVRVIRQENAGKPAALNRGVRAARHELVIMIDGDTIFEPDTVRLLVQPFADPSVGAVAGNVKIANRDELVGRLQHIEYVVGFNIDRRVQDALGSIATIPGAAGAFRRSALLAVGGLSDDTLAEDTDVTIALGRAGWRVVFEDRAYAWTEAPASMSQLWRQRFRWSYGTMQAIWKHRRAVREGGSAGRLGRRGLAHVAAFHILLPVTAPLVDVFLVYGLVFADAAVTLLLWSAMLLVQLGGALYAFRLEGEDRGALWVLPVQQLMYRQLMYLVLIASITSAVTGARVRWQRMHRIGVLGGAISVAAAPAPAATAGRRRARRKRYLSPRAVAGWTPRHERWIDVLRAAALIGLVVYEALGAGWVSLVFPSLGVLFATGGSLMARSIGTTPAIDVIGHRLRRLLVPLWALGVVLVPVMLLSGWATATDGTAFYPANLLYWLFPLVDPPVVGWAAPITGGLFYLRACLWFVLLTPFLLTAFRRRPVLTALLPLAVVGLDAGLRWDLQAAGGLGTALIDFCTFAPCWMLGFAHRDGALRRVRPTVLLCLAVLAIALGGAWTLAQPHPDGLDLGAVPLGQALVSAGLVLLLLRLSPHLAWLDRAPLADRLLTAVTIRATTIYLSYPIAIGLAVAAGARFGVDSPWVLAPAAVALTAVAVLAFGWVEDVAARRPRQLRPVADTVVPVRRAVSRRGMLPVIPMPRRAATGQAGLAPRFTRRLDADRTEPLPVTVPVPRGQGVSRGSW